jgi:hypothetical protein
MSSNELFPLRAPICSICHQSVPLSSAKTDEDGSAVHEACYLVKLGIAPRLENDLHLSKVYILETSVPESK